MDKTIIKVYELYKTHNCNYDVIIKYLKPLPKLKAYVINLSKIDEGYLYSQEVVYANTVGEAKSIFLGMSDKYYLLSTGDECTFLTLPLKRNKYLDKYKVGEGYLSIDDMLKQATLIQHNTKLSNILNNPSIEYVYVKKDGKYYCDNAMGYTHYRKNAGIFSKKEGVNIGFGYTNYDIIPIDIDEHNQMIEEEIKYLKSKLICVKTK